AAKVHPVLVVFALLAGEHLFGFAGALLAVPVLSITQSFFLHYREFVVGQPVAELPSSDPSPPTDASRATADHVAA
ncbi:MAG: AI-2E family transporter, partial [Polyangiaceae bacterium]|nr:AI-2E family transporter [Polyangiaceae bacterium]